MHLAHPRISRVLLAASLLTCFTLRAQAPAPHLTFDVVSIHPSEPGQTRGGIKALPGGNGYMARNIPVKVMIALMYRVPMSQIKGDPNWLEVDPYDVDAKVERPYGLEDLHSMYQNMLIDRFNLKFHWETHEGNLYALTVDPSGSKLKPNHTPEDFKIPLTGSPAHITGVRVSLKYLTWWLGQVLADDNRPVVNKTGLSDDDFFDFSLSFNPPAQTGLPDNSSPDLPNLFDALREQLGLRLTPQKGPVQQFVIDHIEKPSDN